MNETYPLRWPPTWPRTQHPRYSQFKTNLSTAINRLERELALLGAKDIELTSNLVKTQSGAIAVRQPAVDQGVAVYFSLGRSTRRDDGSIQHGQAICMPCDKWMTIADNIHAIELTIAALRGLERWGAREMIDHAFAGFAALPAGATSSAGWWEILKVAPTATRSEIDAAFRALVKRHHPDVGGSNETFREITTAYEQAKLAIGYREVAA